MRKWRRVISLFNCKEISKVIIIQNISMPFSELLFIKFAQSCGQMIIYIYIYTPISYNTSEKFYGFNSNCTALHNTTQWQIKIKLIMVFTF